jgi:hypothetical protein
VSIGGSAAITSTACEPDLFLCLAQRGLEQRRVAGLALAAGEAELVSVTTKRAADDEHEP